MKYQLLIVFIFLLFFLSRISSDRSITFVVKASSLIAVPDDYPTIQSAIDAATTGDTIIVRSGTYNERLTITKSLKIYGSNNALTTIKSPWGGDVVYIRANYVTFAYFQIEGKVGESFGAGIYVEQGNHNQILENIVSGNRYGIYLWDSFNITLKNNNISNNLFNFGVWGLFLEHFLHNVDVSNIVEGKPVYYWINERNKTVPSDAGYVAVVNSTNIVVKDLNFTNNFHGVAVVYSFLTTIQNVTCAYNNYGLHVLASNNSVIVQNNISNNNIGLLLDLSCNNYVARNIFSNNQQGIVFSYSPLSPLRSVANHVYQNDIIHNNNGILIIGALNNQFSENEISYNKQSGILAVSSSGNVFCGNTFRANSYGLYIENSSNNTIYNNNFVNNTLHVYTGTSVNAWNSSLAVGGNYWSDIFISDMDLDGIADLFYVIDESNIDTYPLAGMFFNYTIFWKNEEYTLTVISNSSELSLKFLPSENSVIYEFNGSAQTLGFCRTSFPEGLLSSFWQNNLTVLINGETPLYIRSWKENTSVYIYFIYPHPHSQAMLIPEFSIVFLMLLLNLSAIVTFFVKRSMSRRHLHKSSERQFTSC